LKIILDNLYSTVYFEYEAEVKPAIEAAQISVVYFTKKKGDPHPTRNVRIENYMMKSGSEIGVHQCPTGIVNRILKVVEPLGFPLDVIDKRKVPCPGVIDYGLQPPPMKLGADYSFQNTAVVDAMKFGRGLLHYPTGAGKTYIMAKIINALGVRALVIVPSLQLFSQTYEKFCEYFGEEKVGRLGNGKAQELDAPVVIATQQSLYSMMTTKDPQFDEFVSDFDALFIDECHHVATSDARWGKDAQGHWIRKESTSNTWHKVAMRIPAYYRFGMSATVGSSESPNDQFILETVTGKIISQISVSELTALGVLCSTEVFMLKIVEERRSTWKNIYEYQKGISGDKERILVSAGAYESNIIQNPIRNQAIADCATLYNRQGRRVLILVDLVENHGKILHNLLPESIFLHGSHSAKVRSAKLEEVVATGNILIGTIFKEGFDLPCIDVLIIATGGKSSKALIQKIGRVLRTHPGKKSATVIDFYDADGSMAEAHSKNRHKIYTSEPSYTVKVLPVENMEDIYAESCTAS
jgi:superfamily II DNA or RNA helicase